MFLENFQAFLTDLNENPVTDEWYMANFVDKNIKNLSSGEAFEILRSFADYIINHYDRHSEYEIVETFRYLTLQANTNEPFCDDQQKFKILELYQ